MKASFNKTVKQQVKVTNIGGVLTAQSPITLKNFQGEVKVATTLTELQDVEAVNVVDGATLVYNETEMVYQVKPLDIDGGDY